jgi:hypothetical protein
MSDDQIRSTLGVEETMQMLQFRESIKSQMSPELYEQNMAVHKASIQKVLDAVPGSTPMQAAEVILDLLDKDASLQEDEREMWKAVAVVAAFEMTEF